VAFPCRRTHHLLRCRRRPEGNARLSVCGPLSVVLRSARLTLGLCSLRSLPLFALSHFNYHQPPSTATAPRIRSRDPPPPTKREQKAVGLEVSSKLEAGEVGVPEYAVKGCCSSWGIVPLDFRCGEVARYSLGARAAKREGEAMDQRYSSCRGLG
jgi:hypothetical protein